MTNNQAKFKQPTLVILYAHISEQARQNFPLLYNNKDTKPYIGEWLRQAGCRFKRNVNLTI